MSAADTHRFFTDREGIEVILSDRVWFGHILVNHPEMAGQERAIEQTSVDPAVINADPFHRDRKLYYRRCSVTGFIDEVVVKVVI